MKARECRMFYLKVRHMAMRAARSWDLCPETIAAIREGSTCSFDDWTTVSFEVGDIVVLAQLVGVFAYAATILNGYLSFRADESIRTAHGTTVAMLDIAPPRTEATKGGAE